MKFRKNLYFFLGTALIIVNLLVDILDLQEIVAQIFGNGGFNIGYLIGSHILLIVGILFLRFGIQLKRKLDNKELETSINDIGK